MTEKQFRKRWLRWHSGYEKIVYRKLMKNFREAGNSIPFNFITKDNYEVIFRQSLSTDKMITLYADFYREIGIIHAKRIGKEINKETKDFSLTPFLTYFEQNIIAWLYGNSLSNIQSVKGTYVKYLTDLFAKGVAENKTIQEITADIMKLINKRNFYKFQALRIARTETTAAANHSSLVVSETSNLVYDKVWIATEDFRTRRIPEDAFSHYAMNGVVVPVDEPFTVPSKTGGEQVMFAGDPKGSAGNIINCRCANALKPRRDKNGKLIRKGDKPILKDDLSINTHGMRKLNFDAYKYSLSKAKEFGVKGDVNIFYNPKSLDTGGGTGWKINNKKEFVSNLKVNIDGKLNETQIKEVISHELKHIEQIQNKRMEFKNGFYYWNGRKYISNKTYTKYVKKMSSAKTFSERKKYYEKYIKLPWELEAHKAGDAFGGLKAIGLKTIEKGMPTDRLKPIKWNKEIPFEDLTDLDKEELNK